MRLYCVAIVTYGQADHPSLWTIRANRLQQRERCAREALWESGVTHPEHDDILHSHQRAASDIPGGL